VVDLIDAVGADAKIEAPAPGRLTRTGRSRPRVLRPREWQPREWGVYAPLLLVAFAVGFGLWLLRPELRAVPFPNDASTHASFARFAEQRIRAGHSPFDAWYPYLGLGSPQFLQYQALSHIVTAVLSIVFGDATFRWANYLLVCTWPVSVYIGARLLGLDRWQAGAAALFSPMMVNVVGYGFEWASFLWLGSGMWSMLWALWLMPIALGLGWRAVAKGERYALAAFVIGLTCAFHFITGYLVLLALGVYVLVRPPEFVKRLGRSALVGLGGLLIFAFIFIPTLGGLDYVNVNSFQTGTFWTDSYGPGKVMTWLFDGRLMDYGRHPIVTLLVGVGVLVCLWLSRRHEEARVPLGLMVLSLLMYSGRSVVGPFLDRLPGGSDLLLHRYIIGVHFAGMLLAGIGSVWLFRAAVAAGRFVFRIPGRKLIAVAVACVLGGLVVWPVLSDRYHYAKYDKSFISEQVTADQTTGVAVNALIDIAKQRGGGRVYAGLPNNWGGLTKVGQVDVLYMPLQQDADSLGFTLRTDSLSQDIEAYFDENNPAQYDLFDVKYVLEPPGRQPIVPSSQIATNQGYTLWAVKGVSGYLEVVDTTAPVAANRTDMAAVFTQPAGGYLASSAVTELRHPLVAFDGRKTPAPSLSDPAAPYTGPPGQVVTSSDSLDNGRFAGEVTANRPSWVMLKESYAPHWRATVDGKSVKTAMLAPSFVGVPVPAGTHEVVFQYHSDTKYPEYVALGVLTLLGLAFGPSAWRRYRRRSKPKPEPEPEPASV
jgi:hypothetical protein